MVNFFISGFTGDRFVNQIVGVDWLFWGEFHKIDIKCLKVMSRILTTETRRKIQEIIDRLASGQKVTLEERIQLKKYSIHIPFIAGKVNQALRRRELFYWNKPKPKNISWFGIELFQWLI